MLVTTRILIITSYISINIPKIKNKKFISTHLILMLITINIKKKRKIKKIKLEKISNKKKFKIIFRKSINKKYFKKIISIIIII